MTEGEVTRIFPTRAEVKEELVDDGRLHPYVRDRFAEFWQAAQVTEPE